MQSAIQNFQLQFVQLFKSIQSIQCFHQLLFGKTRRQAQRVQKLCLALGAARPAGKPPLVEVGIGDLASFRAGRCVAPPSPAGILGGLLPRFQGTDSVLVAASMLGATVMPHAVYLHSSLVNDHEADELGPSTGDARHSSGHLSRLLRATRIDIYWALSIAGLVNIGLLLLAAAALAGQSGTDTIEGAHAAISSTLGPIVGTVFAVGLLASGLASTSVGAYAGSEIMNGLLHIRVPILVRRLISLIPALIILGAGAEPTWALVVSQVALSFGIPFAIIPLMHLTASRDVMGEHANTRTLRATGFLIAAVIVALNLFLVYLTFTGQG